MSSTAPKNHASNRTLAVIMGGGAGTRLFPLTKERAKPAVPIGGKYRLVDVPVSNCINSDIRQVYVLTQFNSVSLHRHIYSSYTFDRFSRGFVEILAALAPDGCAQWAAFRSFDRPALVLFPALDIETVESLVESPDSITGEELVSLVLADAREVMRGDRPFGVATLDHDLIAHADLSDVVDLVQFPGYGLLLAPSADGIRLYHPDIAI